MVYGFIKYFRNNTKNEIKTELQHLLGHFLLIRNILHYFYYFSSISASWTNSRHADGFQSLIRINKTIMVYLWKFFWILCSVYLLDTIIVTLRNLLVVAAFPLENFGSRSNIDEQSFIKVCFLCWTKVVLLAQVKLLTHMKAFLLSLNLLPFKRHLYLVMLNERGGWRNCYFFRSSDEWL